MLFPLGDGFEYSFLNNVKQEGYILKVDISKSGSIKKSSDGQVYVRRGAQNLPYTDEKDVKRLERNKGITSFEIETINADIDTITNSLSVYEFMYEVIPHSEPESWLRKQQLIRNNKPVVAGIILYSDEPQSILAKRCGLKVYRYKTSDDEGTRAALDFDPISIDGNAYIQIQNALQKTVNVIQSVRVSTAAGLEYVTYPETALHEIITNAVLHRDYSISDDIHIRIFDNRVEVISPGTLPAHITTENILSERFARNGIIVRLINKFPNPPNKDVGEGLNTAFTAMREMKLKPPLILQEGNYVKVSLKHEKLATPQELILDFLKSNYSINNKIAREICYIGSENQMKRVLQLMVKKNLIELIPGTTRYNAAYRMPQSTNNNLSVLPLFGS
ncbi:ATP-dependent DNA helicase RecG [Hymenobacter psychrophilus]|uniref:ATP-dependent DNA helicase RecG n=2 Tax=Hymenobacter psychrophilus TaxID=651662 RepID=A0A1H3HZI8_9BACT|nr:ATP-dependent DNA helicase RecG [Hymenobacter psychrophilus]